MPCSLYRYDWIPPPPPPPPPVRGIHRPPVDPITKASNIMRTGYTYHNVIMCDDVIFDTIKDFITGSQL